MNTAGLWYPFALSIPILLIGGISLYKMRKPRKVNLLRIFLAVFALHFGLMPWYGFFKEWLNGRWPFMEDELMAAYWCLYVFMGGIMISLFIYDRAPKHFRRGWTIPQVLEKQYSDISVRKVSIYFLIVIGFLLGFNIYFGYTSYASGTIERNLSVPYPLFVAKSLSGIFVCGLVGYGVLHLIRGKKYMLIGVLLLLSNNFIDLYSRRKYLLVIMLLILVKLLLDRLKISVRQVVIVGTTGLFLLLVFFPFLFVFRQLTIEDPRNKKGEAGFLETYEIAQGSKGEKLSKGLDENEAYRANQIARNIEYMRYPGVENRYMDGLLFAYQASQVIPRVLYPTKIQIGKSTFPESIIFIFYGKKVFDMTDNLPVYGYLEYGYWGAFFIGIFQAILLIISEWFAFQFQRIHSFLGLSVLTYVIYHHLNLEYHYITELARIRELTTLFLIIWPISVLYRTLFRPKRIKHRLIVTQ